MKNIVSKLGVIVSKLEATRIYTFNKIIFAF